VIYYFFYFVVVISFLISFDSRLKPVSNLLYLYLFIACTLLVSLNYKVGQDYVGYEQIFSKVPIININESFSELIIKYNQIHGEYGFLFVNSILKTAGLGFNSVYFFTSSISLSIIAVLCWKKLFTCSYSF